MKMRLELKVNGSLIIVNEKECNSMREVQQWLQQCKMLIGDVQPMDLALPYLESGEVVLLPAIANRRLPEKE